MVFAKALSLIRNTCLFLLISITVGEMDSRKYCHDFCQKVFYLFFLQEFVSVFCLGISKSLIPLLYFCTLC